MRIERVCKSCGLMAVFEGEPGNVRLMHEDPVCDGFEAMLAKLPKPDKVEVVVEEIHYRN